jgi:hypothetical protein
MTCDEFLRLLDEDAPLDGGDALAHLAECPSCARAAERERAVRRELTALGEDEAPPFLHARIMAHVQAADRERRELPAASWWRLRAAWAGPLLVVACVVILGGYVLWRVLQPSELAPPPAARAPTTAAPAPAREMAADNAARPSNAAGAAKLQSSESAPPRPRPKARPRPALPAVSGAPGGVAVHEKEVPQPPAAPATAPRIAAAPQAGQAMGRLAGPSAAGSFQAQRAPSALVAGVPAAPPAVACWLHSAPGGLAYGVTLPAELAPAPERTWSVTVRDDKTVAIDPAVAHLLGTRAVLLARRLVALGALPGDYRLARQAQ